MMSLSRTFPITYKYYLWKSYTHLLLLYLWVCLIWVFVNVCVGVLLFISFCWVFVCLFIFAVFFVLVFYLLFSWLVGLGGEVFGGFLCFDHVMFSTVKPVSYIKTFKAKIQSLCSNGNRRIHVFHPYVENRKQAYPRF